jgi:Tol biopolymer transport system component
VAFLSVAANLVPGDTNEGVDAFRFDRYRHVMTRVSVATGGAQVDNGGTVGTTAVAMSAAGTRIAFASYATNAVADDTNHASDVFVHDMRTGVTTRVSVATGGGQAAAGAERDWVALSADGRYVVFVSDSPDLVPGDTNGIDDVFVHDMRTGVTTRVSVATDGSQAARFASGDQLAASFAPAISADGRYVAFDSSATNLVPNDGNDATDVFVHDMRTGVTSRAVATQRGVIGSGYAPAISAHGRYIAFESRSTNLVPGDRNRRPDMFERDRLTGATWRVSVASDGTGANARSLGAPAISADGRFVAFDSDASNLVPHDTNGTGDVFVHDARTGRTTRISVLTSGAQQPNGGAGTPAISADGCCATYSSFVPALDTADLYVRLVN